jgi:hypothetical protein
MPDTHYEEPFYLIQFPHLHVRHRQVLQSRQVLVKQFLVHTKSPLHLVNWISSLRLFRLLFSQPPVPAVTPAAGSLTLGECSAPFSDGSSWTFTPSSSGTWRIFFFQRYRLPE